MKFDAIVSGIHGALVDFEKESGVTSLLIMCFLRDMSKESAATTLEEALSFKDFICSVGLDSKEIGNPPRKFEEVFRKARKEGFRAVAHAGEEAPASYVWEAIKLLGVSRVDHGYHALEDPKLVSVLAKEKIPLTSCPLASLGVHYFDSISDFPLKRMLDRGLVVNVNSDDPAYFGGYVAENLRAVVNGLRLTDDEVVRLLKNSFLASFLDEKSKNAYVKEIDRKHESLLGASR